MSCETKWINSFKGIAILAVMMIHYSIGDITNEPFTKIVNSGAKGVQIFFMISAYLIYWSLDKNEIHGIKSSLQWILKKILSLMPLYYIGIVVHLLVLGGSSYWLGSLPNVSVLNVISHVLFLHGFYPYFCNSILNVEWYIGVLGMLYFISPLLHKYVNNFSKAAGIFLVSLVISNYLPWLERYSVIPDEYVWSNFISNFNILAQSPAIIFGIVLYYFLNSKEAAKLKDNWAMSYCILFFSLFVIYRLIEGSSFYGLSQFGLWSMAFGGIIFSQVIYRNKLICNGLFGLIGKYSYGIYLFHYLLIMKIPKLVISNRYLSWIINYIVILVLSFSLSILLNYGLKTVSSKVYRRRA
jgi:peptidoglycan/LPS O-acetylase OafA/YrhL